MALTLINPPTEQVVSLDEFKEHIRVTTDDEDTLHILYIQTATSIFESYTGLALREQQWRITLDDWFDKLQLPRNPVISIDRFEYFHGGNWQTFTDYIFNDTERPATLTALSAPALDNEADPRIAIEYTSGQPGGSGSGAIEDSIKFAIMTLAAHFNENREAYTTAKLEELPFTFTAIANLHKIGVFEL
jgi:uncharacterized phiE125 gp8 family phage protein